jgi:Trk-type K+ transport system membrane component
MFIGASPSSVGGGVRTTTFAIVCLYTFSFIKNKKNINAFHKRISIDDLRRSIVVFNLSLLLCFSALLILMATQKNLTLIEIIVEVASAFGTTGLSLGATSVLNSVGKVTIAILMFVGRVGPLYLLTSFIPKNNRDLDYQFPTERIIIG